jgi:formylglycine-generating enzyme required for sulfatase activity
MTVRINGGTFDLGSDDGSEDRKPAHTVTLSDYYLGTYEIKQEQWEAVMGNNPSKYKCHDCPVTNVNWDEVQEFITKLNAATGKTYRLPTEAEWEFAARGGTTEKLVKEGHIRGGVNEFLVADNNKGLRTPRKELKGQKYSGRKAGPQSIAWYINNAGGHVHPVGRKQPNDIGVYDMTGNVEEWCADWYAISYGSRDNITNPSGPIGGKSKVVRGGSISSAANETVVTRRAAYLPDTKSLSLGFRLVEERE